MNLTSQACYSLVATAFVLSGLILLQASTLLENRAHAEMVVSRNSVTMLTTQFRGDSEILYVLDASRRRLFAYSHNPSRQSIELLDAMDLGRAFSGTPGAPAAGARPGGAGEPRRSR